MVVLMGSVELDLERRSPVFATSTLAVNRWLPGIFFAQFFVQSRASLLCGGVCAAR
jgi:hypothetical protein